MRRRLLLPLLGLSLVTLSSCTDSTIPTRTFAAPTGTRYQLSASGTLGDEIDALIVALFPKGLETAAGTRWDGIRSKVASGDLVTAKAKLLDLVSWVRSKQAQMDAPPAGESRETAVARLVLYMSLYVYNGPTTLPPPTLGTGADAIVSVVSPDSQTTVQTPLKHAGARFDAATVSGNTIVVISQNTQYFAEHCGGPFATSFCQYPLFYHYQAFPQQKFLKPVHMAVCHIHTGDTYGPLAGVDHDALVLAHDKPASSANYTPGGYPVPGEGIELLPRNPAPDLAHPLIACTGAAYPSVALFEYAPTRHDKVGVALAAAARGVNRAIGALGAALTPRPAYAIDLGVETEAFFFSTFVNVDTSGHPDLATTSATVAPSAGAGQSLTIAYTVANNGTAPAMVVAPSVQIVPTAVSYVPAPVTLPVTATTGGGGALYPLQSRSQTATVTLPASLAPGAYSISVSNAASGGEPELTSTTGDNALASPLQITALGRFGSAAVDGVWSPGEWDVATCSSLPVNLPGGGTAPGTLCWQNTTSDLFVSLRVATTTDISSASLAVELDSDASGSISLGDDAIVVNRQVGVFDDVYTTCPSSPGLCGLLDTSLPGGTINGTQGWGFDGSAIVVELSHPLNSGDTRDMALTAGQVIGARFEMRFINSSGLADTDHPTTSLFTPVWTYPGGPFYSKAGPGAFAPGAAKSRAAPKITAAGAALR